MLLARDSEKGSALCVAKVLLLLRLNTQTDFCGTKYVCPQSMECTLKLDEMSEKMGSVCLRESTETRLIAALLQRKI